VVSSWYGTARPTQDVDIVADLQFKDVRPLVKYLETDYYIDADAIRDAIRHRSSFNVIYLASMLKIDVFIPKPRPLSQHEQSRARQESMITGTRSFYFASPEDTILNKLEWYKMGGESSTRQWNDILGVFERQGTKLDLTYLERWARTLDVAELLERAITEAKLNR
jgi:hypothetical protein